MKPDSIYPASMSEGEFLTAGIHRTPSIPPDFSTEISGGIKFVALSPAPHPVSQLSGNAYVSNAASSTSTPKPGRSVTL